MIVYKGTARRQVGGGIWSTIIRGIRPLVSGFLSTIKPVLLKSGKAVAKRAAKSAVNVGSDLAVKALSGDINKQAVKSRVMNEVDQLKGEAKGKLAQGIINLKRKLIGGEQGGSGPKRRRIAYKRKSKTTKRKATKGKRKMSKRRGSKKRKSSICRRKKTACKRKVYKRKTRKVKKSKRRSHSRKRLSDIFN